MMERSSRSDFSDTYVSTVLRSDLSMHGAGAFAIDSSSSAKSGRLPSRRARDLWLTLLVIAFVAMPSVSTIASEGSSPAIDVDATDADRSDDAKSMNSTSVGQRGRLMNIKIEGSELETIAFEDRRTPFILRIMRTYPHGSDWRYDFEYYGLEPGTYDLTDYVRRKDGSSTDGIAAISVEVYPVLDSSRVEPNPLERGSTPRLGGYRLLLIGLGVVWVAGLAAIIFWKRAGAGGRLGDSQRPKTLADQIRPLVEKAMAGDATHTELARLERSLLTYWRRRLGLDVTSSAAAIQQLRQHPEAGGLMGQLERWLHDPSAVNEVDVDQLLAPYRKVTSDQTIREFSKSPTGNASPATGDSAASDGARHDDDHSSSEAPTS